MNNAITLTLGVTVIEGTFEAANGTVHGFWLNGVTDARTVKATALMLAEMHGETFDAFDPQTGTTLFNLRHRGTTNAKLRRGNWFFYANGGMR
jgi:hypothetical protein